MTETFIYKYIHRYTNDTLHFQGRPIWITKHAIIRARERGIAYPDQVYYVLKTGRVKRYGKHGLRFIKKSKAGSIICVGEDLGHAIIIKTIERGN